MGLLDSNMFLFAGNKKLTQSAESLALDTLESKLQIAPKSGYKCVCIIVEVTNVNTNISIRGGSKYLKQLIYNERGEILTNITYYNALSDVRMRVYTKFYVFSDEIDYLFIWNDTAISGGTISVQVEYLKDIPEGIVNLKPRQEIYRRTIEFSGGETSSNRSIADDNNLSKIMRYFKYGYVTIAFYDSSGNLKNNTGTFRLRYFEYMPYNEHAVSTYRVVGTLTTVDFSNISMPHSEWFEMLGTSLRYETSFNAAMSEGDKMVISVIGIR